MLTLALAIAAVAFVAYAVYAHYQATPVTDSVWKRVWTSVVIAAASAGAALLSWIHDATGPSGP